MQKKLFTLFTALVLAAMLFAACQPASSSAPEATEVPPAAPPAPAEMAAAPAAAPVIAQCGDGVTVTVYADGNIDDCTTDGWDLVSPSNWPDLATFPKVECPDYMVRGGKGEGAAHSSCEVVEQTAEKVVFLLTPQ